MKFKDISESGRPPGFDKWWGAPRPFNFGEVVIIYMPSSGLGYVLSELPRKPGSNPRYSHKLDEALVFAEPRGALDCVERHIARFNHEVQVITLEMLRQRLDDKWKAAAR